MDETLARELAAHAVPAEQLPAEHRPILAVLSELLGVVPNCYPVLAIWPPGLRTFNVLVPNLLNLPRSLMGQGAPKDLVALALFTSSAAAGCPYCTAHHCSYALRRGLDADTVLGHHTPTEAAVAELAEAMATVPATVTTAHVRRAEAHLGAEDLEWVVLAVALGGFLNKFMDAVGIELEERSLSDVQAVLRSVGWTPGKHVARPPEVATGDRPAPDAAGDADDSIDPGPGPDDGPAGFEPAWTRHDTSDEIPVDGLATYLRLIRQAPAAARLDRSWTRGVPGRVGEALLLLEDRVGYGFPVLGSVSSPRVVRSLTTALRDNLDPWQSTVGVEAKLLAGLVYAHHVESPMLAQECVLLLDLNAPDPDPWLLRSIQRFATAPLEVAEVPSGLSLEDGAVVLLARACAASPADISEIVVEAIAPHLDAEQIVEVLVWLSLLQTLHRLYAFVDARAELGSVDEATAI